MKDKLTNKKKSFVFLALGMIGVLVFVLLLSMRATRKMNEYIINEEEIYLFFENEKFEFHSELLLNRSNDITSVLIDGKKSELGSEPIFIKNKDIVIFPSTMSIVFPLEGVVQKKVNYFSKVKIVNDDVLLDTDSLKEFTINKAFFYDGNDLYFFVDDVEILIDERKIQIPAFSFVDCRFGDNVYVFNYSTKQMNTYNNVKKDVKVTDGNYIINLNYDLVEFNDSSVLLVKNVQKLSNLTRGD